MNNKPKISVILTSYNHAKYIGATIESILNQTFSDFELIILDNISDDNSVGVINSFSDKRIRFIQNPVNMGMVMSVNKGISLAQGEYVALISSDDIWLPEKLEMQVDYLEKQQNVGAVFTSVVVIDESGVVSTSVKNYQNIFNNAKNKGRDEWLGYFFNKGNCLCYPSALVRKKCFDELGVFDARFQIALDLDMWVRVCSRYEIYVLDEALTKFRSGSNSTSSSSFSGDISSYESEVIYQQYLGFEDRLFSKIFHCDSSEFSAKEKAKIFITKCLEKGGNHMNVAFKVFNDVFKNPTLEDTAFINKFFSERKNAFKNFKLIRVGSTYKTLLFLKEIEKKIKLLRFWKYL